MSKSAIVFGPVPSRRLGFSLGINHIPPKNCPYSCVYCQVGRTTRLETTRREYYHLEAILEEVERKIEECKQIGQPIDALSLVPNGEPTLDLKLGSLIEKLKPFGIPVAVISNAALIDRSDVQEAVMQAEWISIKVDSVIESEWRLINRPHGHLRLPAILAGLLAFRNRYQGVLVSETMLVSGINDREPSVRQLAGFLVELQPLKSYLSIPTRPPAETWVRPPNPERLQKVIMTISEAVPFLELLFETETEEFPASGDPQRDILSITAVHPMREESLRSMLARSGADWKIVEDLVASGDITFIPYRDESSI